MRPIDADELIKSYLDHKRTEFEIKNCCMANENVIAIISNAPTVFDDKAYSDGYAQGTCDCEHAHERPQGEYVDISKLRLMTVEECAGHTIDYAMGWKACIEWIKKGGAE